MSSTRLSNGTTMEQRAATETAAVPATAERCLRVTGAADEQEVRHLTERVARRVDARLRRWNADQLDMHLVIRHRDTPQQKVTLETNIARRGATYFVATSRLDDLLDAVADVAHDIRRQIGRFVDTRVAARRG